MKTPPLNAIKAYLDPGEGARSAPRFNVRHLARDAGWAPGHGRS